MGADFRGDPASAMLEVLDPEQHSSFRDHYLDLPFDLSKVLFICTANTLDTVPGPLLDRMDVIQLSGYTYEEKLGIAKRYLVPKQLKAHGLKRKHIAIPDKALRLVIAEYTREAGVRNLERQIATLCRKAATQIAMGRKEKVKVDEALVREWLGPRRFSSRGPQAHRRRRRRHRPRVHHGRRRRPLHRGDRVPRARPAEDHGPARRGDAGIGAGGALLGAVAHRGARRRAGVVHQARRPHPRPGRGGAEGRPVGGRDDGDGDRVARAGRPCRRRRRHDRRDHPHRPGAADRRRPREGARRPAGRPEAGDPAARRTSTTSTTCRPRRRRSSTSCSSTGSRRFSSTLSPPAPARAARAGPRWCARRLRPRQLGRLFATIGLRQD